MRQNQNTFQPSINPKTLNSFLSQFLLNLANPIVQLYISHRVYLAQISQIPIKFRLVVLTFSRCRLLLLACYILHEESEVILCLDGVCSLRVEIDSGTECQSDGRQAAQHVCRLPYRAV
jgi:hypothetical protein